jgi:hypothetical protein
MNLSVVFDFIRFLLVGWRVFFFIFAHWIGPQGPSGRLGLEAARHKCGNVGAGADALAVVRVRSLQGLGERISMVLEKSHLMRLRAS